MKITALDIRKQEFARTFRGYDPDEVDSFMQVVATGWQEMVDDLRRSQEKIDEQRMKLEHYMKVEEALEEALQTARSSARQTIESAEKKAGDLLEEAENRIVRLQKEADANRLEMKRETARYAVRQQEIVAKLRSFLVSEMEMLRHFEADTGERTLQQATSRREIEMYRDENTGQSEKNEVGEDTSHEETLHENTSHEGTSHADNGQGEAPLEARQEEVIDHPTDQEDDSWDADDDWDEEEDWDADDDDDEYETFESGQEHEEDVESPQKEFSDQEDETHASEQASREDDREDAAGWRVTPVFESADDSKDSDTHARNLETLPDDGADDEIKKIHEILKGLDEEQDADEE